MGYGNLPLDTGFLSAISVACGQLLLNTARNIPEISGTYILNYLLESIVLIVLFYRRRSSYCT